jgi:large repetitive protein
MAGGWKIGTGYRTTIGSQSQRSHTVDVHVEVRF